MNDFAAIDAWLRNTYNIGVSAEWLTACLEWIQQENIGQTVPVSELKSQVYEQWLVSDLGEIGEPVLPVDVTHADKFELISNYPLQLLSLVDVGFPLYGQKQKLQGRENPNEEVSADKPFQQAWEPKPSRTLILQLTDGHTHVQAMEYQQIKILHHQLPGGTKLLLSGTLVCRHGMILLTSDSVQLLGGEVDALMEENSLLANIERAMEKNKEDEGRHARKDFSGKFITRGSDKKIDGMQKSFVKKEGNWSKDEGDPYIGFSQIKNDTKPGSQFNQSWMKRETKHKCENQSNLLGVNQRRPPGMAVKTEAFTPSLAGNGQVGIKREINSQAVPSRSIEDIQNVLQGKPKAGNGPGYRDAVGQGSARQMTTTNSECEGDTDYSDLFDDEMDLDEIDALDTSLPTSQDNNVSASKISSNTNIRLSSNNPNFGSSRSLQNQNVFAFSTNEFSKNMKSNNLRANNLSGSSLNNKQTDWPKPSDEDMVLFDDDFEIDEIADPTLPASTNTNEDDHKDSTNSLTSNSSVQVESSSSFGSNKSFNFNSSESLSFMSKAPTKTIYQSNQAKPSDSERNSLVPCNAKLGKKSPAIASQNKMLSSSSTGSSMHFQQPEKRTPLFKTNSNPVQCLQRSTSFDNLDCNPPKKTKQCKLSDMFTSNSNSNLCVGQPIISRDLDKIQTGFPSSQNNVSSVKSSSSAQFTSKGEISSATVVNTSARSVSSFSNDADPHSLSAMISQPRAVIHPYRASVEEGEVSNNPPYRYLSELSDLQPPYSVIVKAYISTLTDKLGSDGGTQWTLGCRINDGTACVDVDLSNTLLTELIGFSAQDSKVMRQRIKTEPQVKEVLMEGLSQCQLKLINISCLMEVEVTTRGAKPMVKNFIPLSRQHVTQLLMRMDRKLESVK